MSIHVFFFASLKESLGYSQTTLAPPQAPLTVYQVWQQATDHADKPDNTLAAVNMEYTDLDALVQDGDEVGFFPPVTGGGQ